MQFPNNNSSNPFPNQSASDNAAAQLRQFLAQQQQRAAVNPVNPPNQFNNFQRAQQSGAPFRQQQPILSNAPTQTHNTNSNISAPAAIEQLQRLLTQQLQKGAPNNAPNTNIQQTSHALQALQQQLQLANPTGQIGVSNPLNMMQRQPQPQQQQLRPQQQIFNMPRNNKPNMPSFGVGSGRPNVPGNRNNNQRMNNINNRNQRRPIQGNIGNNNNTRNERYNNNRLDNAAQRSRERFPTKERREKERKEREREKEKREKDRREAEKRNRNREKEKEREKDRERRRRSRKSESQTHSSSRRRDYHHDAFRESFSRSLKLGIGDPERRFIHIKHRYQRLYIPKDFTKVFNSWRAFSSPISLNEVIQFKCSTKDKPADAVEEQKPVVVATEDVMKMPVRYFCRIMLLSGQALSKEVQDTAHLSRAIKFLVLHKGKNELECIGEEWNAELDGNNPQDDDQCLINTAKRAALKHVNIDLSKCETWIKFLEITYDREDLTKEITTIFIPAIWEMQADATALENESDEVVPAGLQLANDEKILSAITIKKAEDKTKPISISLRGLLEYTEKDKEENTFEVSLFAEVFLEMLQHTFASQILEMLESISRKRGLELDSINAVDTALPPSKRAKISPPELVKIGSEQANNTNIPPNVVEENNAVDSMQMEENVATTTIEADTPSTEPVQIQKEIQGTVEQNNQVENTAEQSAVNAAQTENTDSTQPESIVATTQQPVEQPIKQPVEQLVEQPVGQPVEQSSEQPSDLPAEQTSQQTSVPKQEIAPTGQDVMQTEETEAGELPDDNATNKINFDEAIQAATNALQQNSEALKPAAIAKIVKFDFELLRAYRFFDVSKQGYLKAEDLEYIILALGSSSLCKRKVDDLVDKVIDIDSGNIMYKKLTQNTSELPL